MPDLRHSSSGIALPGTKTRRKRCASVDRPASIAPGRMDSLYRGHSASGRRGSADGASTIQARHSDCAQRDCSLHPGPGEMDHDPARARCLFSQRVQLLGSGSGSLVRRAVAAPAESNRTRLTTIIWPAAHAPAIESRILVKIVYRDPLHIPADTTDDRAGGF